MAVTIDGFGWLCEDSFPYSEHAAYEYLSASQVLFDFLILIAIGEIIFHYIRFKKNEKKKNTVLTEEVKTKSIKIKKELHLWLWVLCISAVLVVSLEILKYPLSGSYGEHVAEYRASDCVGY